MNQELKEKLHYYLPWGLMIRITNSHKQASIAEHDAQLNSLSYDTFMHPTGYEEFKPHMRPLSSLTKEIVVSNYNDGKPFMAFHELGKLFRYRQDENNVLNVLSEINKGTIDFRTTEKLFQWHFWIGDQALFDTGEIIRIER